MNMLLANAARFGYNKVDVFIVGSTGTSTQMGLYNVAAEFSSMVPRELTSSVGRALYPSLAQQRRGQGDFAATFMQVVGWIAAACLPIGLGLWVVADDAVRAILGPRWSGAVTLMRYLAIYGMLSSLTDIMLGHVLLVTGHERRQTLFFWLRLGVLVACVLVGLRGGVDGIALGAMVSGFLMLAVGVGVLVGTLNIPFASFVGVFWRPIAAALVMAGAVHGATMLMLPPLPRLMLCVAIGALVYLFVLVLLWRLAGRPNGIEETLFTAIARRRNARRD
jgi:PST family polysaccharide transporter